MWEDAPVHCFGHGSLPFRVSCAVYSAARLVKEMTEAVDERRQNKLLNTLSIVDLLIMDEVSYLTFNRTKSE